jgi:spermidine synthase
VVAALAVVGVLVAGLVYASSFEVTARQALYRDPVVAAERTPYQDIVITQRDVAGIGEDTRLFLNGDLQFSSIDEYRYHESLVHPVMAGSHQNVLVLGGGDGLAMREVLKYPDMRRATLVELDPAMIDLARHDDRLTSLNRHSLDDPRAHVVVADAFSWLRSSPERFDAIIVDMPDPDETATAKLYSEEFYGLVRAHLAPGGRMVVQAGSPYFAPKAYWCIASTVRAAGLAITPYHVDVPTFGDWGFVLATAGTLAPTPTLDAPGPLRFLTSDELRAAVIFPRDRAPRDMPTSTLIEPRILSYSQSEWAAY